MIQAAVVDASVAVKWVVPEEGSDQARLLSEANLAAPDLLPVECANILWKKVRLGHLKKREAADSLRLLLGMPVVVVGSRELLEPALRLATELDQTVYDCLYLALAIERQFPLVTADEKLAKAARKHRNLRASIILLSELTE